MKNKTKQKTHERVAPIALHDLRAVTGGGDIIWTVAPRDLPTMPTIDWQ